MPYDPLSALSKTQREQLAAYERLLLEWNERVNLISRATDPADVYERHILHSLALAQYRFPSGAAVADFGTGGGLPGIPLAVVFPDVTFHLVDSTLKKLRAVTDIAERLGLANVCVHHSRAERWSEAAHYAVSRATAPLSKLWRWYERVCIPFEVDTSALEEAWAPGLLCLKGGNLRDEIAELKTRRPTVHVETQPLRSLLGAAYFEEKVLLHATEERGGDPS